MRPIDADALAKRAYEVAYPVVHGINDHERGLTLTGIAQLLDKAPTVEPKRGRWIEDAKTYYEELNKRELGVDEYTPYFIDDIACSECLAKYSTIDNETQFFKFCPNCGAKME